MVNDGSSKEYDNIFKRAEDYALVLGYKNNKGKGYALKHGYSYIKNNYKDYIVITMDSDGQHTVEDAIKLCDYVSLHPDELVIGKRLRDKKIPIKSKIGNSITRFVYKLSTGVSLYDTQTGLRAFTNKNIDFHLKTPGEKYEYEMNVLLYAPKENIKIKEIEIQTIYIDNNSGSHFNPLKDSFRIYLEIIKFSLSSFICFLIDYLFYTLFVLIFNNVIISNIFARVISSATNYTINKKYVFKNNKKGIKSILEYYLLAIIILVVNTFFLNFIVNIGINKYIAKILIESIMFIFSWFVQKYKIFKKE